MKILKKESITTLPPAVVGSIANTRNIKDKVKNTYSAKVIEELLTEDDGILVSITNEEIDEIIV